MTTYKWAIYIYIKVFDRRDIGRVQSLAVCAGTENFQRVGWGGGVKVHYFIVFALEERGVRSNFR